MSTTPLSEWLVGPNRLQEQSQARPPDSTDAPSPNGHSLDVSSARRVPVPSEVLHDRLGHRSVTAFMAVETYNMWSDIKVQLSTDPICISCPIAAARAANRGHGTIAFPTQPGQVIAFDLQKNPYHCSLTPTPFFPYYFVGQCLFSKYAFVFPSHTGDGQGAIEALKFIERYFPPFLGYKLKDHFAELRCDAGSIFLGDDLDNFGAEMKFAIRAAGPNHQEQNGSAERLWQSIRQIAFAISTHARVSTHFFHEALLHAQRIFVVLPVKGLTHVLNNESVPCTPFAKYYNVPQASVKRFRVFGCPCVITVGRRKSQDPNTARHLNRKNNPQRGIRGIHCGFPLNQAGYRIFIPSIGRFLVSVDVVFDESFLSTLVYDHHLFPGSLPLRGPGYIPDPSIPQYHVGLPPVLLELPDDQDPSAPWAPSQHPPPDDVPLPLEDDSALPWEELASNDVNIKEGCDDEPSVEEGSPQQPDSEDSTELESDAFSTRPYVTRSGRTVKPFVDPIYQTANAVLLNTILSRDATFSDQDRFDVCAALTEVLPGEPGSDPALFLPEPRGLYEIIKLPPHLRKAWLAALVKEFKGLVSNQTFSIEPMKDDDKIMDAMDVYKCKIAKDGTIDKLKCRIVCRGDTIPHDDIDTWNPHGTFKELKIFLGECARLDMIPGQTDFTMAYLQCATKARVFVKIPSYWSKYIPEELRKYCGVPLRMLRCLYGYFSSGRTFWEEQAVVFRRFGLQSCEAAPALWYKHYDGNIVLYVLQYSDDLLFASNSDAVKKDFIDAISSRFNHNPKPMADWYLSARITRLADGSYTLDQFRYAMSIVRRYLPNELEEVSQADKDKYIDPLPATLTWTRDDCSKTAEDVHALEQEFIFKYREVTGSFNFLGDTAIRALYDIRKACKFMNLPGRRHFEALRHMLHHVRCHPPGALRFYKDVKNSPIGLLLYAIDPKINPSFAYWSDSSHQDADECRSTGCYLGTYQGGVIEMNSFVPPPIAMSTGESENNTLCLAAMGAQHSKMIIQELRYGNPDRPYTVPVLVDSQAAEAMTASDKDTKRTRHVERRWHYSRHARQSGHISVHKCDGETQQLADLGTKVLPHAKAELKYSYVHVPISNTGDLLIKEGCRRSVPTTLRVKPAVAMSERTSRMVPDSDEVKSASDKATDKLKMDPIIEDESKTDSETSKG